MIKVEKLDVTTNEILSDEGRPGIEMKKQFNEVKIQTMEKGNDTDPFDIIN